MAAKALSTALVKLNDGTSIPILGYGTGTALFKKGDPDKIDRSTVESVKTALEVGYTHLDGAEIYNTESELGIAVKESGIPRSSLYITTKISTSLKGAGPVEALKASLKKLGMDHVDLYLIHSPYYLSSPAELQEAWRGMEACVAAGLTKSIGVSNFLISHLETVLEIAKIKPAVNQVEYHAYLQRLNLVPWSKERGIVTAAFGPLVPIRKASPGPLDPVLEKLSKKYGVGKEAVMLRWVQQMGVVTVTTSNKRERLLGYADSLKLDLTEEEVKEIAKVGDEKHFRAFSFMHDYGDSRE